MGYSEDTAETKRRQEYADNYGCNRIITIEGQLEQYIHRGHGTERYEIMWHAWKHNKRWLVQLQEWILPSFQAYSKHDESHVSAILHNIEMLLGEDQIRCLSASDCFLILHVVYIHDIGMCITHEDRRRLMQNEKFVSFLKGIEQGVDDRLGWYAKLLLSYCEDMPKAASDSELLSVKLDIYYAILYLVAEYQRKEHASRSKRMLEEWIDNPEKLGIGFSTSGIPSRFFYTIASAASVHTSYDFDDVLALHKVDTGYAHDYMHPRFAAVLLQLGDALDLDNDRFHPLVKEFIGSLPHESSIHFGKHKAIRRLRISPDKITIEANCENPEVLRLVNDECESIKDILKNATFHWSAICPEELNVCLPAFEPVMLLLNGQEIQEELVNVKFAIQQKKAFNLLQGSNIYKDDSFVFLREIFQNAIDASKMQYWLDWVGSRWYQKDCAKNLKASDIGAKLSPLTYPVEIEIHIAKKEKYGNQYRTIDRKEELNVEINSDCEYGVLVKVTDHGVGMTAQNILEIADVGTSYENRKDTIEQMPAWLQPTAEFGIGLQASFLASNLVVAYTRPRTGERYKIEFQATGNNGKGYITTTPLCDDEASLPYGTTFEIFVPNRKKKEHKEDLETWSGKDPFSEGYEDEKEFRHARELALQLAVYLDCLIGEKLFPIKLRLYDFSSDNEKQIFSERIPAMIQKLEYCIYLDGKKYGNAQMQNSHEKEEMEQPDERNSIVWSYRLFDNEKERYVTGEVDNDFQYALDCEEFKLYLWNSKWEVYARMGADRLFALRDRTRKFDMDANATKMKIYYKGVYIKGTKRHMDADLLEYIDIKGKLKREHLAINRGAFTEQGYQYIYDEIYPAVLEAAHRVLEACESKGFLFEKLEKNLLEKIQKGGRNTQQVQEAVLSVIGLAMYAQIQSVSDYQAPNDNVQCMRWNDLLKTVSEFIEKDKNKRKEWTNSTFFQMAVYEAGINEETKLPETGTTVIKNIADILFNIGKYAVISRRNNRNSSWEEYLVYFKENGNLKVSSNINSLKRQWDPKNRKETMSEIEEWGNAVKNLYDSINDEMDSMSPTRIINQTHIINWMLDNIPSTAVFFDETGNVRVNLLNLQHTDSIFFDTYSRWSILERMKELYESKKIERFAQFASTGFCQLAYKKVQPSVYFVKRGKLCMIGQRLSVQPFSGPALEYLFQIKEEWDNRVKESESNPLVRFFAEYEEFLIDYINKCPDEDKLKKMGIEKGDYSVSVLCHKLLRKLLSRLEQLNQLNSSDLENAEKNESSEGGQVNTYKDNEAEITCEVIPREAKIDISFEKLLSWCCEENAALKDTYVEKQIREKILPKYREMKKGFSDEIDIKSLTSELYEICGLSDTQNADWLGAKATMQNMIRFVAENNWANLSEKQVKHLFELYVQQIAEDINYMHQYNIKSFRKKYFILGEIACAEN